MQIVTMVVLIIMSIIAWAKHGNATLQDNWNTRPSSSAHVTRAIFNGICIAFLGVTGFECTPAYIETIGKKDYGSVLRNILWSALLLNAPLMLLVYVHLPAQDILSGANVLSLLSEAVAGKWLRILIVVDACIVLSGGILAGLFTGSGLLEQLAHDGVLPEMFLKRLSANGGPVFTVLFFFLASLVMYASSAFKLTTISSVFSVTFLAVMLLVRFRLTRAFGLCS